MDQKLNDILRNKPENSPNRRELVEEQKKDESSQSEKTKEKLETQEEFKDFTLEEANQFYNRTTADLAEQINQLRVF